MVSRTAKYYHTHPAARKKKAEYDKKFNEKKEQREKRVELIQHNRDHTKNGIVYKKSSVNRGSKSDTAGDKRARGGKKRK